MSGYRLSPAAQADLEDIWDYSEETWGAKRAERYVRDLQAAIESLAADPRRGRPCDEVRPGYLKFAVNAHVVFYRSSEGGVDVIRILHGRMDFDRHL